MARDLNSLPSDFELLSLSRAGDRAAFAQLWERHRLAGITAARHIAPSLDADDLVSGAYLKILELLDAGKGPTGAFRPYLYRVITSLSADEFRSPETSSQHLDEIPDLTEAGLWEDGAFDLNAASRAFEKLPERWRAVLWYSEVEGLAPRQIAPLIGLGANGVSALIVRAREGLQSAWVEEHIDMQLTEAACRTAREHLQRFQRGKLTSRRSREVAAHLDTCADCAAAAAEFKTLNKQLALVLSVILVGGPTAATLVQHFGATAVVGASSGAAASTSTAALSGGATASASGVSAGFGTVAVSAAATVVLAAAAVGGVAILGNSFSPSATGSTPAEASEQSTSAPPSSATATTEDVTGPPLEDHSADQEAPPEPSEPSEPPSAPAVATPSRTTETDTDAGAGTDSNKPAPVAPVEIVTGAACYLSSPETDEFALTGIGSAAGTVVVGVSTSSSIRHHHVQTADDGSWVSNSIDELEAFVDGRMNVQVRLVADDQMSLWESVDRLSPCD